MRKLTKTVIDHIKPGLKDEFYWCGEVRGFGVRMTPTRKLSFIVQGRIIGTDKSVRLTIGPFGIFTVDQAREVAKEHLRSMRLGVDPRLTRKAEAAAKVTLGHVMQDYVSRPGKLKESSGDEYRRHVEDVLAAWTDRPIVSISEDEVRRRHRELMDHGLRGNRAAPASANAAMITLRILINFANRQYRRADGSPLIPRNPVDVLKDHWAPLGSRTQRYIDKSKIGQVWNKLQELRADPANRSALAGIDLTMMLLLTGARRMEMATLTWARVNLDDHEPANCWFHLPDNKSSREIFLPLSLQAVALLKARWVSRPCPPAEKESPFVFTSWSDAGHVTDARGTMKTVSKVAGKHLSLHDLRRTFTNIAMRECLIEKFRTDLLTNHVPDQADVTSRNYLDLTNLSWLQGEVQKVGDFIERQALIASSENVTQLIPRTEAA
jgi:integrase